MVFVKGKIQGGKNDVNDDEDKRGKRENADSTRV
jgi:hypothetical protein